jgi:tetratricopeptide (TPR) repeat protein
VDVTRADVTDAAVRGGAAVAPARCHPATPACLVLILAALACGRRCPTAADRPPGPVASALIAFAADLGAAPTAIADAWLQLQNIAARVERRRRGSHADAIDDLDAVVFGDLGFEREIASDDPRFFTLSSVISARRGSCLGLSALYLALGEVLDIPLDGVLLPGHFFVRTRAPHPRNVELLRQGEAMPDRWYRTKYGPWPQAAASAYGRPVSVSELIAVHWYNAGNHQRAAGDLRAAEADFARAVADFPTFAEAQASLGAVRQLRGSLPEAAASYREAARARADLPGLVRNMALLRQEQQLDSH